jgi:hypothetical protein
MSILERPSNHHPVAQRTEPRAIGPVGTWARLLFGLAFVLLGLLLGGGGIEWTALLLGVVAFPAVLGAAQLLRLSIVRARLWATGRAASCVNLGLLAILLAIPATSRPTFVFLGVSMLVAAWRGYAGCESLAISNWILRRDDQVGCLLFSPIDELEARVQGSIVQPRRGDDEGIAAAAVETRQGRGGDWFPALVLAVKLAGCASLVALLVYLARW